VLPAYANQCAICRLRRPACSTPHTSSPDKDPKGLPAVSNGLSLCTIHHRAFDEDLVGISPDYEVHVAPRRLDDEDGPMLDLLKKAHAGEPAGSGIASGPLRAVRGGIAMCR
jgi:putative restriction endonuclease